MNEVREFLEENDAVGESYVPRKYGLDLKPLGHTTLKHKRQLSAYRMQQGNKKPTKARA